MPNIFSILDDLGYENIEFPLYGKRPNAVGNHDVARADTQKLKKNLQCV